MARRKRYVVEFDGKTVTELGSLAGLRTAMLASLEQAGPAVLSFAYPGDARWLSRWAETGGRRVVVIRDSVGAESFVIDVAELRDTSGDGQIFEAVVHGVRREPDPKTTRAR
jgi:hypothetical protein